MRGCLQKLILLRLLNEGELEFFHLFWLEFGRSLTGIDHSSDDLTRLPHEGILTYFTLETTKGQSVYQSEQFTFFPPSTFDLVSWKKKRERERGNGENH